MSPPVIASLVDFLSRELDVEEVVSFLFKSGDKGTIVGFHLGGMMLLNGLVLEPTLNNSRSKDGTQTPSISPSLVCFGSDSKSIHVRWV